ncbi:hypothetical protein MXD63_23430 [Frankia sp. Cpl3]|uniref:hypothetical protein n=1 Tax=Parafrankia colletiae TaxID=573497 RepID=UPI001F51E00B|nr:hypothetical protein [Parafrankia colletiae]MCK9903007.1 hypothetical protein [Frankia sp. Cpl3]
MTIEPPTTTGMPGVRREAPCYIPRTVGRDSEEDTAALEDRALVLNTARGNELIHRLLAGACEICGETDRAEVHHLADLNRSG